MGSPVERLIKGVWQRSKIYEVDGLAAESGRFEYEILQAKRWWSREVHADFPKTFRVIVRMILLSATKSSGTGRVLLPSDIWCNVFSFVGYDWFYLGPKNQRAGNGSSHYNLRNT